MTKLRVIAVCALIALFAGGGLAYFPATVAAQGNCGQVGRKPSSPGFIVDLCERDPQGGPNESPNPVRIPTSATARFIVLLDCGDPANAADQGNVANWSDVVHVVNNGEVATAQLVSQGGSFPTVSAVIAGNPAFVKEIQAGTGFDDLDITMYIDGPNTYNIHSAARNAPCAPPVPPAQVPEGDTLMLVGTGLAGLAGYAALRWRARRAR